eukprot:Protomagalhaensia_sp_Gyna_25__5435@NODE_70_length_5637_cov_174_525366_g52_i0_p1_GENE_NODE_70_length_5637_cov_174_525366_g52_i0NODE_70_length_5637_cov_174_525366_g52_i0_p1_ORF_typecomplete_len562_score113_94PALP/PF00291_25/3_4e69Glu_dehyd_C/PF16912_5/0_057Glu_dehyd_C/PF16912_5/1_5e03NmrA/PF05368_13/0_15Abhydrolase_6/PF12697_7/2_2e02Abhydrolase_6/PF12697_7/1_2ADH_zinc_N/PF00107_26/0_99ADH_zinc_N/PF00107_26/1_5e03_NODE_70_length_5637_cov_174_525366_g52_i023854070
MTDAFIAECMVTVKGPEWADKSLAPPYASMERVKPVQGGSTELRERLAWPDPLESVIALVGNTPLLRLKRLEEKWNVKCKMFAKLEFMSPGGSIKDRIARHMVLEDDLAKSLKPGDYVLEATSGNTGVGLALMCAARGFRMIVVMPDKMSAEKAAALKALGAQVIRTRTTAAWDDPDSHVSTAYKLCAEINRRSSLSGGPRAVIFDQYKCVANPTAHFQTTAEELLNQLRDQAPPDWLVICAGTGGTLTGCGTRLKQAWPNCRLAGVDPTGSILSKDEWDPALDIKPYEIEGIGYDFHPPVLDRSLVDIWETVSDIEAFTAARTAIATEGVLCGGSSGAALAAAARLAAITPPGGSVVMILPDSIRNYLTRFASDSWMFLHGWLYPDPVPKEDPNRESRVTQLLASSFSLTSLPTLDFSLMASSALQRIGASRHGRVLLPASDNKQKFHLISKQALERAVLIGAGGKCLVDLEYRMTAQLLIEGTTFERIRYTLDAMLEQQILDPLVLVVIESGPSGTGLPAFEVDPLRTTVTVSALASLDTIKLVSVDLVAASLARSVVV